jgi:hypothetical protein
MTEISLKGNMINSYFTLKNNVTETNPNPDLADPNPDLHNSQVFDPTGSEYLFISQSDPKYKYTRSESGSTLPLKTMLQRRTRIRIYQIRIRICLIHQFLILLDPNTYSLVSRIQNTNITDPNPDLPDPNPDLRDP